MAGAAPGGQWLFPPGWPALRAHLASEEKTSALASKRHDNVMADCRKMASFYAETYSPEKSGQFVKSSTYTDSTGRELPCFEKVV